MGLRKKLMIDNRSLHGLFRSLINNMVIGVDQLFSKTLELKGVGYKGSATKTAVTLNLGYSHPISLPTPDGIEVSVENNTVIHVKGIEKKKKLDFLHKKYVVKDHQNHI